MCSSDLLTLGNASVDMKVNGSPVTITPAATSIGYLLEAGKPPAPLPGTQQPRCT